MGRGELAPVALLQPTRCRTLRLCIATPYLREQIFSSLLLLSVPNSVCFSGTMNQKLWKMLKSKNQRLWSKNWLFLMRSDLLTGPGGSPNNLRSNCLNSLWAVPPASALLPVALAQPCNVFLACSLTISFTLHLLPKGQVPSRCSRVFGRLLVCPRFRTGAAADSGACGS